MPLTLEINRDPVTPLALAQQDLLVLHHDLGYGLFRVHPHGEINRHPGLVLAEAVGRAFQLRGHSVALAFHRVDATAADVAGVFRRILGEKGKGAVGAEHVRSPHAGESPGLRLYRGEVGRDAEDGGGDVVLRQHFPEGFAVPQQNGLRREE
jgi:hypothetical protein